MEKAVVMGVEAVTMGPTGLICITGCALLSGCETHGAAGGFNAQGSAMLQSPNSHSAKLLSSTSSQTYKLHCDRRWVGPYKQHQFNYKIRL